MSTNLVPGWGVRVILTIRVNLLPWDNWKGAQIQLDTTSAISFTMTATEYESISEGLT